MNVETLEAATVRLETGVSQGTGYLIASNRLATCHHVVESAGPDGVTVTTSKGRVLKATLVAMNEATDCAILKLEAPLEGVEPLRLAVRCEQRAPWDGFGFPRINNGAGLPFFGTVLHPESSDDKRRPMITLYSEMVGAGRAAMIDGLSGGPIAVGDRIIGHFSRVVSEQTSAGHPALGVIYAARASRLLELTEGLTVGPIATAEVAAPLSAEVPPIGPDEYHAFISYRSTNRAFANRLYERLDGMGLRVFLDQNELVPGDTLSRKLHEALGKSRSGIVLVSRGWLESPWCVEEGNRLVTRAIKDKTFRLIPLRLDDVAMPGEFDARLYVDFYGEPLPEGRKLLQVTYAVLGKVPPSETSSENKQRVTRVAASDEALRVVDELGKQMKADPIADPRPMREIVEFVASAGLPEDATRLRAADALIGSGWLAAALDMLQSLQHSLRATQLRALALSKLGDNDAAIELLTLQPPPPDAETAGILGGVFKRMWLENGNPILLHKSFETYRDAYVRSSLPYLGINVATLALLRGDEEEAARVAREILANLGAKPASALDAWDQATLGEAFLCLGDEAKAIQWYGRAAATAWNRPQDVAVMRRQARLIYSKRDKDDGPLTDALPTPRVVAFSGHLTDAPDRAVPRFPESKEKVAGRAIRKWIKDRKAGIHGVCAAARGGDLLFLESIEELQGTATVLLPFPKSAFKAASVGPGWSDRFDAVLESKRVYCATPLLESAPPEGPERDKVFEDGNIAILDETERLANLFDDAKPCLLTLWSGKPGDGPGGTSHAVETWRARGFPSENIDVSKL